MSIFSDVSALTDLKSLKKYCSDNSLELSVVSSLVDFNTFDILEFDKMEHQLANVLNLKDATTKSLNALNNMQHRYTDNLADPDISVKILKNASMKVLESIRHPFNVSSITTEDLYEIISMHSAFYAFYSRIVVLLKNDKRHITQLMVDDPRLLYRFIISNENAITHLDMEVIKQDNKIAKVAYTTHLSYHMNTNMFFLVKNFGLTDIKTALKSYFCFEYFIMEGFKETQENLEYVRDCLIVVSCGNHIFSLGDFNEFTGMMSYEFIYSLIDLIKTTPKDHYREIFLKFNNIAEMYNSLNVSTKNPYHISDYRYNYSLYDNIEEEVGSIDDGVVIELFKANNLIVPIKYLQNISKVKKDYGIETTDYFAKNSLFLQYQIFLDTKNHSKYHFYKFSGIDGIDRNDTYSIFEKSLNKAFPKKHKNKPASQCFKNIVNALVLNNFINNRCLF